MNYIISEHDENRGNTSKIVKNTIAIRMTKPITGTVGDATLL